MTQPQHLHELYVWKLSKELSRDYDEVSTNVELHDRKRVLAEIDILAEKGEGELAVYRYIKAAKRAENSYKSMQKIKDICNPVGYQELAEIATVWADAALKLAPKDLRMMQRLVRRQNVKLESCQKS